MSEPRGQARVLEHTRPEVLHWWLNDDRIHFRSDAYALLTDEGSVLIDPLPLDESLLPRLEPVHAIVLTGGFHQRSAWRYRKRFGVPLWAPEMAPGLDFRPDHFYDADEVLPGGLRALHAPGPAHLHFALMHERADGEAALFIGDLLIRPDEASPLAFVPGKLQDNPDRTRETVRQLLEEIRPSILFPSHGAPVLEGASDAMRLALASDAQA